MQIESVKETRDIAGYKIVINEEGNEILQEPPLKGYLLNGSIFVPIDTANSHYQAIQQWIKEGNKPEPAFTEEEALEEIKKQKLRELKQSFEQYITKQATVLSQVINKEVNARQIDIVNIDSLLNLLQDDSTTIQFRCADNTFAEITKSQLEQIKQEVIQHITSCYNKKWEYEKAINNSIDIKELLKMKFAW